MDKKMVFIFGSCWKRERILILSISGVPPWIAALPSFFAYSYSNTRGSARVVMREVFGDSP